jgi:hypothetical protein
MVGASNHFAPGNWRLRWTAILGAMAWNLALATEPAESSAERVYQLTAGNLVVAVKVDTTAELPRFDETAAVVAVTWCERSYLGGAGLVDEFGLEGVGVLGYEEASVGGKFIKIGVGVLQRDLARAYRFQHAYPRLEKFPVGVKVTESELTVEQASDLVAGYGYRYRKHYQVDRDGVLTIRYELGNTGIRAFVFEHYNHNFFCFAEKGGTSGDGYGVETAFPLSDPVVGLVLDTPRHARLLPVSQSVTGPIFWRLPLSAGAEAHRVVLTHANGRRVELTGDTPVVRFCLWTDRRTVSPELFSQKTLAPGQTTRWVRRYRFETGLVPAPRGQETKP